MRNPKNKYVFFQKMPATSLSKMSEKPLFSCSVFQDPTYSDSSMHSLSLYEKFMIISEVLHFFFTSSVILS